MTKLWLLRHGETDWNVQRRWQGQSPSAPPLNARGVEQCRELIGPLSNTKFEGIYSSDLTRAQQSASILGEALKLEITLDSRLREINLGIWEGLQDEEIRSHWPREMANRIQNPLISRAPGGESLLEVSARIVDFANFMASKHPKASLLIVSHRCVLATLVIMSERGSLADAYQRKLPNAEPIVISWEK